MNPAIPTGFRDAGPLAQSARHDLRRAQQLALDRTIALKIPLPGTDGAGLAREAAVAGAIDHPGVRMVHAAGEGWLALHLVDGHSLAALLASGPASGGPLRLSATEVIEAVISVADTLAHAHAHGVPHGPVSADHILLGHYGETLLIGWSAPMRLADTAPAGLPTSSSSPAPS